MSTRQNGEGYLPIPAAAALKNWKVKNNGEPFDEAAALRYLDQTKGEFSNRADRLVASLLSDISGATQK